MSTGLLYLCLAPLTLILAPWGFGSMMSAMGIVRGWNVKRLFWISAISYALLQIGIFLIAWFVNDVLHEYDVASALLILIYLIAGVGILIAPLIGLVIRRQKPALFGKPMAGATHPSSNILITPRPEPSLQKQPSSIEDTSVQQPQPGPVIQNHQIPVVETKVETKPEPVSSPAIKPRVASSHIFVSYRRSDSADITGRIYDRLIGKFGKGPIFKDVDSIPLGLDFKEYLDMKVGECDVFLAIIGSEWLTANDSTGKRRLDDPTDFVRIEIESALERKIPVIPLLVRDAHMPRGEDLPPSLRKLVYRNGTPIRSDPDFHRDMDRLIAALEKYITKDES